VSAKVDETKYFDAIAKYANPNLEKGSMLKNKRNNLKSEFARKYGDKKNPYSGDF